MKKLRVVILVVAVGVAVWFVWSRYVQPGQGGLELYGNVDQRQISLAFMDAERVAEVLVEEGEKVSAGQVLARLETRRLQDSIAVLEHEVASAEMALNRLKNGTRPEEIDQARAAVVAEEAEVAFARTQYERYNTVWKNSGGKAVSQQDVDETRLRLNVAEARLLQALEGLRLAEAGPRWEDIAEAGAVLQTRKASLEDLRNRLGDAELRCPHDSVVQSRLLEPGDMASPSRAVFSLAILDPKWVRAYVSGANLGFVQPGMEALVVIDSFPGEPLPGRVGFISSVAEFTPKTVQTPELRTALVYEVRILVQDPENRLRLGMPATVVIR